MPNWLSLDPLETPNRYNYANSNPVNFVDFTGLYGELPGNFAGSCQQDGNMACAQGEMVQPLSESARYFDSLAKLKLTIPCGSTLSWEPYFDSVFQAILDVQAKVGSFSRIFGNLEFRLYRSSPGSHAAETKGSTLVEWYDNIFSTNGIGGGTPAQNRTWNIVHELGHVLDNRTNHDLRRNAQDVNRNNLLAYAQEASTTMRVQNQYDNHVENVANLFMFWIYNAIDAHSNEADAARAFAEGGLIVRQKGTGNYSFIYVGANPSSFIETIARNLVSTDDSYFLGITRGSNIGLI